MKGQISKMKRACRVIDKVLQSKVLIVSLLGFGIFVPLAAIAMPEYDIYERSFSNMGYENPIWFAAWGICTGLGVLIGYRKIAQNTVPDSAFVKGSIKPSIKRYLMFLMSVASVCVIVLSFVYEQGQQSIANYVHLISAQLFGVFFVGAVFGLFVLSASEYKHHKVFLLIILASAIVSFVAIVVFDKMNAQMEFLGMLPTLSIMMLSVITGKNKWALPQFSTDEIGIGA
ncbi:MAG: hypothetical protein FWF56_00125 [Firmicutes bacterium]|nr:hypothetical protein [Bacillota bacterium]